MSFDALLTLVFILLFVVGPLLRRMSGGRQQPPGRGDAPRPRPPTQAPPQQGRGETEGPLGQRLEEARRRVLEAMGEGERAASEASRRASTEEARQASKELDWQPDPYTVGSEKRRELDWQPAPSTAATRRAAGQLDWQPSASPVEPFIRPAPPTAAVRVSGTASPAPAMRTEQRRVAQRPDRLRFERPPALDRTGILNGIVWHEILSDPVSRRGNRRQTSRLRSR